VGLTFPGAQAFVDQVHADLRRRYSAIPRNIAFSDEPAGDFGIAHMYYRTTGDLITFDEGRVPVLYVVAHELGHALSANVTKLRGGNGFTNGLYDSFWGVRGYPGTPWEAQQRAIAAEAVRLNSGYRSWPEENFADAFGAVNSYGQGSLITEGYGAYLDESALRAFYASLEGVFDMLTEEELAQIRATIAPMILDVLNKLDSGFNTTEVIHARRVAHGKDPGTGLAPIQEG
jgi:hypothetical protein